MKFSRVSALVFLAAPAPLVALSLNMNDLATYDTQKETLALPAVLVNELGVLYKAKLDLLSSDIPFHFQLTDLLQLNQLTATGVAHYQLSNQTLTVPSLYLYTSDIAKLNQYHIEMQAVPHTQPMQFLLKNATDTQGTSVFDWAIRQNKGSIFLADRQAFDQLAETSTVSGVLGVRELKFVLVDVDTSHPILFFVNSVQTEFHYTFVRDVLKRYQHLGFDLGNALFSTETYFRDERKYLAGSIVAYDNFSDPQHNDKNGLFTLEFWPTDSVPQRFIEQAYHTVTAAMPFLPSTLAYHPVGNTHESELEGYKDQFVAKNIRTIHTDTLFATLDSAILNKGEAYGRLKIIQPGDPSPGVETIAIYTFIPNTLGHVGGIITEAPQTPLSHINLKARQNNTPNAYIKNVRENPDYSPLINQWVHYVVTDQGVSITSATEEEALAWLGNIIPKDVTIPKSDLSVTSPQPLENIGHNDWIHVGVKAANVAELGKILDKGIPPQGYALPFAMYDQFMSFPRCVDNLTALCGQSDSVSLYNVVANMLSDESFNQSLANRAKRLKAIRKIIEKAEVPQSLIDEIETVRLFWEPEGEPFKQKLRVRSSTNNEDLEGFNGAGLYDSFTHKPKEGKLVNSIKQVWAGLWNERAFEERRLHHINHLKTYMGVLIHPNYGDEQANGVAITKNIYNPIWKGVYINAQYGELSITNPEPIKTDRGELTPIPDELVITRLPVSSTQYAWETSFIRHSNIQTVYDKPVTTENVLTHEEIDLLRKNLQIIHQHFKKLYQGEKGFAMDIEFKITETKDGSRGKLAIKQARPWVD
jgi:hypothetical protein